MPQRNHFLNKKNNRIRPKSAIHNVVVPSHPRTNNDTSE